MILHAITCRHDGTELRGQIAFPSGPGPHPGVLVMSNAHGLAEQARHAADRLAEKGYVALATDMYGNGAHAANPNDIRPLIEPLMGSPAKLRARVVAWHEVLRAQPSVDPRRTAAIGYCFGGQCVLELARGGADVKAVVSYHGLLSTSMPAQAGAIKGQVVVYTGAKDPYAPRAHVDAFQEEMAAAGAKWHVTVFSDAYHAFTDKHADTSVVPGLKYDALADSVSWAGTLALLQAELRPA